MKKHHRSYINISLYQVIITEASKKFKAVESTKYLRAMNLFARLVCYAFMAYVVLPESYVSKYLLVELEPDYEPEPQPWPYNQPPVTTTLPPVPETTATDEIPEEETEPVALGRSMGGGRPKPPGKKGQVKKILVPTSMYFIFFHEDCDTNNS